jgi:hypothetical protein
LKRLKSAVAQNTLNYQRGFREIKLEQNNVSGNIDQKLFYHSNNNFTEAYILNG